VAIQQQQQQQHEWAPRFDYNQTRKLVKAYDSNPNIIPIEELRQHAAYHNVPFYEGDFSLYDAIKQLAGGFTEGFTTLKVVDPPDNEYEAIFRNIGHLAGFAPGIIAGPAKALRLTGLAKAATALGEKSVPMWGARKITDAAKGVVKPILQASQAGRFKAMDSASTFLLSEKAKHMAEGAFHLGTASAISSVWDGVDGMMHSFFGGAVAGGVFRGIGGLIGKSTKDYKYPIETSEKAEKYVRGLAGSLFMGIPATSRGATTPEQIYEYLMGAYFGGKEMPFYKAQAGKFIQKMDKKALKDPKVDVNRNPEEVEGFRELPEITQKEVKKQAESVWGNADERTGTAHMLMQEHGILDQIPKEDLAKGDFSKGYPFLSEVIKGKAIKSGELLTDVMAISGGAKGADTEFAKQLKKAGVSTVHYVPAGGAGSVTSRRVPGVPRELSNKEALNNIDILERASVGLNKRVPSEEYNLNLLLRNAEIVKKSSKVYAVGNLLDANSKTRYAKKNPELRNKVVEGGTGWGVQMAVNARKPVFLFDQKSKSWHMFNYKITDGGRFVPIIGTPELVKRPGVIGSRKLTKEGKGAIKQLVAKAFPESFKGVKIKEDATLPGAVDPKKEEVHTKTAQQLVQLADKGLALEKRQADILDVLKDTKIDKLRRSDLKDELADVEKQLKKNEVEIDDILKLRPEQYVDRITGEIVDEADISIDTGMSIKDLGKKSVSFSRMYLKDYWDKPNLPQSKNVMLERTSTQIQALANKYVDPIGKVNRAEEFANEIEANFPGTLPREGRGFLRAWMRTANEGQPVRYLRVQGKKVGLTNIDNPQTFAGKRKKIVQPKSILETVYEAEKPGKEKGTKSSIAVWDEITVRDKGINKDIELGKYKRYLINKGLGGKKAAKIIAATERRIMNEMYNKHQMVPFGGVGDKGRITFVKLHPQSRRPINYLKTKLSTIKKELSKVDKHAYKLYNKSRKAFIDKYGKTYGDMYDRIFHSNVMYDLALNGFSTKEGEVNKSLKILFGKGFVPNAVNFNKRAQIWQNSFFSGDKNFFKGKGLEMNKNGNFNYILIKDPEKVKGLSSLKALNNQLPEHVDGAIITRTNVLNRINLDAGVPESGQNKSFIVSRGFNDKKGNPLGTLLGKYMMHDAGPELSAQMRAKGLHYMVMTSAAKQIGTRKVGNYSITKTGKLRLTGGEVYELDPGHIFYSPSTFGQKHMLTPQIWVKQLFTNLHQYGHKAISKDIIEDINQSIIQSNIRGTEEGNALVKSYTETLNEAFIPKIIKNIDKIGTAELIEASKQPGAEKFADALLQKMLRVNVEAAEAAAREGEMTSKEAREVIDEMSDFVSSTDRLLGRAAVVSSKANAKGKTGFPVYFHKYVRDYRMAVLHNWVAHKVTRPKVENSSVGFIRPYDKMLQHDKRFAELNTRDDIFYLDKAYEDMNLDLAFNIAGSKRIKLGKLWEMYQAGDFKEPFMKKYVEDTLNAVVLRVPMDSMSGAHKLQFKGFTDRNGYGILMHSRTMRALGGADLDGDEAFVYFGGRTKAGEGKGMKNSWKEAIHAQKEEFYSKGDVGDNKKSKIEVGPHKGKTFAQVLAEQGSNELKESKTLYYSPEARMNVSMAANAGRGMLGIAANSTQIIKTTYSNIMDKPGKKDVFEVEVYNKKKKKKEIVTVTITPRESAAWRKYQREMTRAQIAFGSDPLDEAGLKDAGTFFKLLHQAHFRTFTSVDGKKTNITFDNLQPFHLKKGVYGKFYDMNRANFGKNYKEGRNWTFEERNKMNQSIYEFPTEETNTMLPKMTKTLAGIDYSDRIFERLDVKALQGMYAKMEEYAKTMDWLKVPMGRSSFRVKYNDEIDAVFRNHGPKNEPAYITEDYILRQIAASNNDKPGRAIFDKAIKGTEWGERMKLSSNKWIYNSPEQKELILREVVRNAEDFIVNDFTDMATIINTKNLVEKHNISPDKISKIHEKSENFKVNSYMNAKRRRQASLIEAPESESEKIMKAQGELAQRIYDILQGKNIKVADKKKMAGDEVSALMDQVQLDAEIAKYKKTLTKNEANLFDNFLLGSLNRGNLELIQKYYNKIPENLKDDLTVDLYRNLMRQAARTSLTRVGFNSREVKESSIDKQLESLTDLFGDVWKAPTKKEASKTLEEVDKAINKNEIDMADGTKEKGYVGTNYQVDTLVEKGLNNEGYAGIKAGNVRPEDKALIVELAGNLKSLNENVGNNLNEILRGITGEATGLPKDLNAFNRQDFKLVNEYLKEVKSGNIFQKLWKDKTPELQKRHWWLFPEAVNKELMKHDINFLKQEGYFINKDGDVKKGIIRKPTYFLDVLMNQVNKMSELSTAKSEKLISENRQDFFYLEEIKQKDGLFSIAVTQRELGLLADIDAQTKTPPQIRKYYKTAYLNANKEAEHKHNWKELKNKEFTITNNEGSRIKATGYEIVNGNDAKKLSGIKGRLNKRFSKLHKLIAGNRDWMYEKGYMIRGNNWDGPKGTQPKVVYKKFLQDVYKIQSKGSEKDLVELMENVGIDGMRHIARSMMVDMVPKKYRAKYKGFQIFDTGKLDYDKYWPHMFFSKGKAEQSMKNAISFINKDPHMSAKDKKAALQSILYRHKSLTGDWEFQDMQKWDRVDQLSFSESLKEINKAQAEKVEKINFYNANQRMGSMMSRSAHVPGWSTDLTVMDAYMRNISNTFFRQMQQIMARDVIETAHTRMKKKFGPELANNWKRYFQLYTQGAMGNPEIIPKEMYNDPNMKLQGTAYAWWADNRVLERVNNIADKLGINKKDLPKELGKFGYKDIRDWSNMEAKFELGALLAHPKTAITNIFGGSLHTLESTGFGNFKKARDIKYLKRINPEFNTLQDVEKWVIEKGILPEMVLHELGFNKQFADKKTADFMAELAQKFNSTDPIERKEIRTLGKKYGVMDKVYDTASKFMSVPERVLRRDAFMAHYVKAWERFGGAIKDPNHPILIEMAKKGVKATQFLYNAPNRPMFARSALGKIMSRFQLFAWNSVRFRNAVLKEAKLRGFKPGAETDRFARMMQIDLFVYALGSMFMYSLFDNALPPPWNWFQDSANWLFGDEKERNKAFFGELPVEIAPLKMVMPPIARIPVTSLQQWVRDDYSKFTDLTVWTMFPFGRMVRDVAKPGSGLMDNPTFFMEKFAGMPLHAVGRRKKEQKKLEEEGKKYTSPKPGVKF
jgi:hypothetical protein